MAVAEREGVKDWAEFVWRYASPVDRKSFTMENFILNLKAIRENLNRLPWWDSIPPEYLFNFVVPVRATQEPLEPFYHIYKDTLYELVKDCKSMKEAILRINEWCFTKMEYRPTAPWDQSAGATIKRGFGRCEEMSILFIKALRTVGIPVRYVYAPWWPFTESNHAWVEVWTPEGWHFLGSAEPTDFDFAWFRTPSKRAGLILSAIYGRFVGSTYGQVLKAYGNYSILNVTKNYANTFVLRVDLKDTHGRPVKNAVVSFCIWNYSALVPLWTDTAKSAFYEIELGRTDVAVVAKKGNLLGFAIVRPQFDTVKVEVVLREKMFPDTTFWLKTAQVSPDTEKPTYHPNTDSLLKVRAQNTRALDFPYIDSLRGDSGLLAIFKDARGNWPSLWNFYLNLDEKARGNFKKYLSLMEDKDLVMLDTTGLRDELQFVDSALAICDAEKPLVDSFVLPHRVYREELSLYRRVLYPRFSAFFTGNTREKAMSELFRWTKKNLKIDRKPYFFKPFQNAVQTLKAGVCSELEYYVFLVSVLRTFGIPARLKETMDGIEYWKGEWREYGLKKSGSLNKAQLILSFKNNGINISRDLDYYYNYSIVKFDNYPMRLDLDPVKSDTAHVIFLDPGNYTIMYGFRNAKGDAFIKTKSISLKGGEICHLEFDTNVPLQDVSEGDFVFKNLNVNDLRILGLGEDDLKKEVFIAFVDLKSELSLSSLNSVRDHLSGISGKVIFVTPDTVMVRKYIEEHGLSFVEVVQATEEVRKALQNPQIPAFIYLTDGKLKFYLEGLNLNVGSLLRSFKRL